MNRKILAEEDLQEIIHRIVDIPEPDRIILFGSAARGEMPAVKEGLEVYNLVHI